MRSPMRWARRQIELARHAPRRRELESEFSQFCGHPVRLVSAPTKGGYDEIYSALRDGELFAVVRANSPFIRKASPAGPRDPSIPLDSSDRLNREWCAYQKLFPLGMAPNPIWRTDDAIACTWVQHERVARILTRSPRKFWTLIERLLPVIRDMHDSGVTHLDLNLGNVLAAPDGDHVTFIDFEFGPVDWIDIDQQMAFDYLRLIDDCTKRRRGGTQMLSDVPRLIELLNNSVDKRAGARKADMTFVFDKLNRLGQHPELCQQLRRVFIGL